MGEKIVDLLEMYRRKFSMMVHGTATVMVTEKGSGDAVARTVVLPFLPLPATREIACIWTLMYLMLQAGSNVILK